MKRIQLHLLIDASMHMYLQTSSDWENDHISNCSQQKWIVYVYFSVICSQVSLLKQGQNTCYTGYLVYSNQSKST